MRSRQKIDSPIKALKAKAERLTRLIFKHQKCVVCWFKHKKIVTHTHPHHLIRQSQDIRLKYEIWNILPLCNQHHNTDKEIAAHGACEGFEQFLKTYLPLHYAWRHKHQNMPARKIDIEDLEIIVNELQTLLNKHDVEMIIYERF